MPTYSVYCLDKQRKLRIFVATYCYTNAAASYDFIEKDCSNCVIATTCA